MVQSINTLRIGIVGTNFVSDWMAEAIEQTDGVQVVSVYSRARETGKVFAEKHNIRKVFTDYESFLADKELDAVYVASPNFAHCGQAVAAAKAGKHILCEKVIATNLSEFEKMRKAAFENNVVLMEAMRPLYDLSFTLLKQGMELLGPIRSVSLEYCQYSSRYDKFLAGEILNAFNPSLSNAAVMDIGVYCIAVCAALFGMPESIVSHSTFLSNGFEGAGEVQLVYPDHPVRIAYSKVSESVTPSVIQGEKGSLTIDKISMPKHVVFYPYRGEPEEFTYEPSQNNMVYEVSRFAELIKMGNVNHWGLSVSESEMKIIEQIRHQNGIVFPADNVK